MSELILTDQEKAAFYQEITRNRTLDYFYMFDNVPLQFIYRKRLNPGEFSDLEKRNKTITETLWLDSYHQELVCNVIYRYFYRGGVLQMPFQIHQIGAGAFSPPEKDSSRVYATVAELRANFDAWMEKEGWQLVEDSRKQPPIASWQSLLGVPDRSNRIVSLMPVGNQVVLELICTWTEDGVLQETVWVVILVYDVDGTVLQDRSYIDTANWPSANLRRAQAKARPPENRPKAATPRELPNTKGIMESFYQYNRDLQTGISFTDLEKRNLSIVESAWLDACNGDPGSKVFHADRYRMQMPLLKCSCNLATAAELQTHSMEAAPDRKMRIGMTFAKGDQVAVECIASWTEGGVEKESPLISFLLLDDDGLVIRERSYINMAHWPGADKMIERLGL